MRQKIFFMQIYIVFIFDKVFRFSVPILPYSCPPPPPLHLKKKNIPEKEDAVHVKSKPVILFLFSFFTITGFPSDSAQKSLNMYHVASNSEHRLEKGSHMVSRPF